MLIGFSVGNHRSFKDVATLSLVDESGKPGSKALLFGANNSGKTNFLRAIEAMSSMVLFGRSCWLPFKMDKECANEPSFFEIVILAESGDRIKYGFKIRRDRVESEWLLEYKGSDDTDTPVVLFRRGQFEINHHANVSERELFLNAISILQANTVREFFDSIYIVALSANENQIDKNILNFVNNDSELKFRLVELMKTIDLPISDPVLELPNSRGFYEAFVFLNILLFAEKKKVKLLAIDNFAESLHPLLASKLIDIANSIAGLQLIILTHQARLMDEVPPSAIWLVEKNEKQASKLTGLWNIKSSLVVLQ